MGEQFLVYFLSSIISLVPAFYIYEGLLNKKVNFKSSIIYIIVPIIAIILSLGRIYINSSLRFFLSTFIMALACYLVFKEKFSKAFYAAILQQLLMFIGELLLSLVLMICRVDIWQIVIDATLFSILMNVLISVIVIWLYKAKYVNKFLNKILNYLDKIQGNIKYMIMILFIITLNILLMSVYVGAENKFIIIINIFFIVFYTVILYLFLNEKNQNIKVKNENKMLLDNLNEYEKMLDYQRVNNHENKNQLMVIRGLIDKKNKEALNYINTVIDEVRADNEKLFNKAKLIPAGGLQGIVYQKMLYMQEKGISVDMNINRNLKTIDFSSASSKMNYDICRIVGIILDNAIDEALKLEEKQVYISMYKEEELFTIEISNKFMDMPDLEKMDQEGYTTKEKGHGYGLPLLKQIIENNKNIINERTIVKNVFTQIIKIKM